MNSNSPSLKKGKIQVLSQLLLLSLPSAERQCSSFKGQGQGVCVCVCARVCVHARACVCIP